MNIIYRKRRNIGDTFNLAVWLWATKSPNLKPPIFLCTHNLIMSLTICHDAFEIYSELPVKSCLLLAAGLSEMALFKFLVKKKKTRLSCLSTTTAYLSLSFLLPLHSRCSVRKLKEPKFPCKYGMVSPHYTWYFKLFHLQLHGFEQLVFPSLHV